MSSQLASSFLQAARGGCDEPAVMPGSSPGGLLSAGVGKDPAEAGWEARGTRQRGVHGGEGCTMAGVDGGEGCTMHGSSPASSNPAQGTLGFSFPSTPRKHCAGVHGPQVGSCTCALLQDRSEGHGGGGVEPWLPKPGIGAVLLPEIQLGSTHCLQRKVQ